MLDIGPNLTTAIEVIALAMVVYSIAIVVAAAIHDRHHPIV